MNFRQFYLGCLAHASYLIGSGSEAAVVLVVAEEPEHVREAQTRLARVGLERVSGYLKDGVIAWHMASLPLPAMEQISVEELRQRIEEKSIDLILDVRRPKEWEGGHIPQATSMPLDHLAEAASSLNRDARIAAICASGYRSSVATSLLEQLGFRKISNVVGGMSAWNNAKLAFAS